ncbi:MAG: hypothetical protein P8R54_08275 [Myxococcota bacterium]|nr:hypothetical protein [Myxococcota bacterium]
MWTEAVLPWSVGALSSGDDISRDGRSASLSGSEGTGMARLSDAEMVVMAHTRGSTNIGMMIRSDEGITHASREALSTAEAHD